MKFFILLTIAACLSIAASAQTEKQTDTSSQNTRSLISADRVKLLANMDVIANMQYGINSYFTDGKFDETKFRMNQFRFEIKGMVHEKVYYRFRNRYTRAQEPQTQDNLSNSIDLAFIRIDASEKWSFQFGKMCADWGGYEFDLNPIDIYEYNDIVEFADNFLTGAQASWRAMPNHEFTFQVLNSRTKSFEEIYDTIPNVTPSKFPAAFVVNWRGNFKNNKFTTLWSYSNFIEARGKSMFYLALGNKFNYRKGSLIYDFKWSYEEVDRKGIVSGMIPDDIYPYAAQDVEYMEHWVQWQHRFAPKWNLALIGMVSNAYWRANPDQTPGKEDLLRTSYGVIPTIEYFPFKDLNLRFFGTHVMRFYKFSDYAKSKGEFSDFNTSRFMVGFITPLLIL
jgi:hypothetical protein